MLQIFLADVTFIKNTRMFGVLFMILLRLIKAEKRVTGGKELRHLIFFKKKPCSCIIFRRNQSHFVQCSFSYILCIIYFCTF
jgi:hypothetical protein